MYNAQDFVLFISKIAYNVIMTDQPTWTPLTAANENADPAATVGSALANLYRCRRELLQEDVASMSLDSYRLYQIAMTKIAEAEAIALSEL